MTNNISIYPTLTRPDAAALVAEWEEKRATLGEPDGWDLFDATNDLEIERDDERNRFEDDVAAYAYVKGLADAGDETARLALAVHHLDEDDVVLDCVPGGFTRRELLAAFNKVANPENWKLGIDARVALTDREREAVSSASVFFAGSPVEIAPVEYVDGRIVYHVTAAGYYACVGA